jgi:alpha-tubulin suppressor-like RCC1 family protein
VIAQARDGTLWAWGDNANGQLGDGTLVDRLAPLQIPGFSEVGMVALGPQHGCAARLDGTAYCWGSGSDGRLGIGTYGYRTLPAQVVALPATAARMGAGGAHSCVVLADGTVRCWGWDSYGQLGDGDTVTRTSPVVAGTDLVDVAEVALGYQHSCARLSTGVVRCWGDNFSGVLGTGSTATYLTRPHAGIPGLTAVALSAGYSHYCTLLADGAVRCWGDNNFGQLGDGTNGNRSTPVAVPGLSGATGIGTGFHFSCAVMADTTVRCWGDNTGGVLGFPVNPLVPTLVRW